MLLPISHNIKSKKVGDCRLAIFSHLLSHYGIEVSPGDMLVATAGLDFSLFKYQVGAQSCFFIAGRRLCVEDEYAKLIGLKWNKKRYQYNGLENLEVVMKECRRDIIDLLEQGIPLYLMVDRFYLSYMSLRQVHMPYHAILVVGYDLDKQEVYAIDSLQDEIVTLSFEVLLKAMFEKSIMKAESYAEIQYIKQCDEENINKNSIIEGITKQKEIYFADGGPLDNMIATAEFLEKLLKRIENCDDKKLLNYVKYQVSLLYTEMRDQDYGQLFYRGLYFEHIKSYIEKTEFNVNIKENVVELIEENINMWKKLINARHFGQKFELVHVTTLIEGLRKICNMEREIFEVLV